MLTSPFAPAAIMVYTFWMLYRFAADAVLITHGSFIAFVLFGLFAIVIGWARGWGWVRNPWFRAAHLVAIAFVVAQAWLGVVCPLTIYENYLRVQGGQRPYGDNGFIAYWLHRLIFFEADPWVFTICYTAFGLLVFTTLIFVPPRWRRRRAPVNPSPARHSAAPPRAVSTH